MRGRNTTVISKSLNVRIVVLLSKDICFVEEGRGEGRVMDYESFLACSLLRVVKPHP